MISLVKVIIEHFSKLLGKRGELRNKDILLTPQLSSSVRMLKFLSSCVLLKMSLRGEHLCSTWQSQQNETISRDAHVSPMGFLSMTKDKIIGRCLEFFTKQKIGMTLVSLFFSLFLLFPNSSYSAVYFLPDAQWDNPINVSIDSSQCEDAGYTYYSSGQCPAYHNQETCIFNDKYLKCDGTGWCMDNGYTLSSCPNPKVLNTQCPNGYSLYKYCVCPSTYKYVCSGTGYGGGSGVICDGKYTSCACSTNYVWSGTACVCDSAFKYTCSGTGYNSGSGASCGGKYKSCNCSTYYSWNGSACAHVHSYVCPSGYSTSNSGMVEPTSTAKVCQLSGCSSTSGTCYKETHVHSYACASGYSTSCSNGYSASSAKTCSHSKCSATSGTCYKCCADTYKYTCSGTGYSSGSGTACSGKYTSCNCASGYHWTGSACVAHSYSCPSGYSASSSGMVSPASTSKVCSCGATSGSCYKETHTHSYSCPSGSYTSSSSCSYGTSGTVPKKCSGCPATSGQCYTCKACAGSTSCSGGVTSSSSCSYGVASSCTDCWGTVRYTCNSCSNTCSSGSLSSSCTSPKTASHVATTQCGNKCYSCVCPSSYQYTCSGTGYSGGSGTACNGKYTACTCKSGYSWSGGTCKKDCSNTCSSGSLSSSCTSPKTASAVGSTECGNTCYSCVCPSSYKYSCSGTGYNGGSGTACNSKYTACSCKSGYSWSGSACVSSCVSGGSSSCSGSTSASCDDFQNKTSCKDCSGTTRYSCVEKTCSDSGYYGGSACRNYSQFDMLGSCGMKYSEMGGKCNQEGRVGQGDCDVDSWRRCCEQCMGWTT